MNSSHYSCFIWDQFVFTSDLQCKHFFVACWHKVRGKCLFLESTKCLVEPSPPGQRCPPLAGRTWFIIPQTQHSTVKLNEPSGLSCLCSSSSVTFQEHLLWRDLPSLFPPEQPSHAQIAYDKFSGVVSSLLPLNNCFQEVGFVGLLLNVC